ncbi:MAG: LAGLIDADG family homing endonuclease, partial [Candidatus Curtissbacteria bacterium]|nr:LAGLIDADG family homing endonuclease [Candidatus Curtissbacteria bacterium]
MKLDQPLQAYFRINTPQFGQFERTLIIAEEEASVHYTEGCFVAGTRVVVENSYLPIETIKRGMKVVTHNGRLKTVKKTQKRDYSGKLFEIEFYGDSTTTLRVTEEHPFLMVKREKQRDRNKIFRKIWAKPAQLKVKDYLVMPRRKEIHPNKDHSYEVIKRSEKIKVVVPSCAGFFRLAGYFLAEGSTQDRGYLVFSFGNHEKQLISDTKQLIHQLFPQIKKIYESVHKTNHGLSLVVASVELARLFADFGRGAANKKIPPWMMAEALDKQKELVVGYFRGDGNYYHQRSKSGDKEIFRMNTVSKTLAFQIRDLLIRLGIPSFINRRSRVKEGRRTMFTVGISGEHMIRFGQLVGREIQKTVSGHNRASMFGVDKDYIYLPIKKIRVKKAKDIPVYNFSVTDDESYLVEGVAVHNCTAPAYSESSL